MDHVDDNCFIFPLLLFFFGYDQSHDVSVRPSHRDQAQPRVGAVRIVTAAFASDLLLHVGICRCFMYNRTKASAYVGMVLLPEGLEGRSESQKVTGIFGIFVCFLYWKKSTVDSL